jgi:hypothetical protein
MGHRANFVIIRGGAAKVYYDQWAALGAIHFFAAGPGEATASAEGFESDDGLMDWAFAEGGYLIDWDQKLAIVFGDPLGEDLAEFDDIVDEFIDEFDAESMATTSPEGASESTDNDPLTMLRSAAPQWAGWQLIWDDRGVDAFSEHLVRRQITGVQMEPPSHPDDVEPPVHFQA